jgi:hypothetical protein
MDQESTTAAQPDEGQEPEGNGQTPQPETTSQTSPETGGKTFDEAYVRQLRRENAANRTKLADLESELGELRDRDKSESERLTERAAESERRAVAAEAKLLRYEVVAERGLPLDAASKLAGETREEVEANADWLQSQLATDQRKPPTFDGGARTTPEQTQSPEDAHNAFLLDVVRGQQR